MSHPRYSSISDIVVKNKNDPIYHIVAKDCENPESGLIKCMEQIMQDRYLLIIRARKAMQSVFVNFSEIKDEKQEIQRKVIFKSFYTHFYNLIMRYDDDKNAYTKKCYLDISLHLLESILEEGFEEFIDDQVFELINAGKNTNYICVDKLYDLWINNKNGYRLFSLYCSYYRRVTEDIEKYSFDTAYNKKYSQVFICNPQIRDVIQSTLYSIVLELRNSNTMNKDKFNTILQDMYDIDREGYDKVIESYFIEQTTIDFTNLVNDYIADYHLYIVCCNNWIEINKTINFITEYTEDGLLVDKTNINIMNTIYDVLILNTVDFIMGEEKKEEEDEQQWSNFIKSIDEKDIDIIRESLTLFKNVEDTIKEDLESSINKYIDIKLTAIMLKLDNKEIKVDEKLCIIDEVLELLNHMTIVKDMFDGLNYTSIDIVNMFNIIVNNKNFRDKVNKAVNLYVDYHIRRFVSKNSDNMMNDTSNLENRMNKVINLYRVIKDKDIFKYIFNDYYTKRLMEEKVFNPEVEKILLSKLKIESGYNYTQDLELMMNEVLTSRENNELYQSYINESKGNEDIMTFGSMVLSYSSWKEMARRLSEEETEKVYHILPEPVKDHINYFTDYYTNNIKSGIRLVWNFTEGNAQIKYNTGKMTYVMEVTPLQTVILNLYNQNTCFTFGQLRELTRLPERTLKHQLLSLTIPFSKKEKKKCYCLILKKSKEINNDTKFELNSEFKSKLRHIKIPLLNANQFYVQTDEINTKAINQNREYQIQSVVVRIMKSRNILSHSELIMEVNHQLTSRFQPDVRMIKNQIASLIDKEYLRRDEDDTRLYHYIP